MLQSLTPTQAFPASLLTATAPVVTPVRSEDAAHHLLPPILGTFVEVRTRAVGVDESGPLLYAISALPGGRPIYIGATAEELSERLRKHASKRKPRADIGYFSRLCEVSAGRDRWLVAAAPPASYAAFAADALTEIRDLVLEQGRLKRGLAARIETLLADPMRWVQHTNVVEWLLVAVLSPRANIKGCVYGFAGRVTRPVDLLQAFSAMVGRAERRSAAAAVAA